MKKHKFVVLFRSFWLLSTFTNVQGLFQELPLGTKRPYEDMADETGIFAFPPINGTTRENACMQYNLEVEQQLCSPDFKYVTLMSRHGARVPTKKKKKWVLEWAHKVCGYHQEQKEGRGGSVTEKALEWCRTVQEELGPKRPGSLTELGVREMEEMGQWFAQAYLVPLTHDDDNHSTEDSGRGDAEERNGVCYPPSVEVRALRTSSYRTWQSCVAFFYGLEQVAGTQQWLEWWEHDEYTTTPLCERAETALLKPYKHCPKFANHKKEFRKTLGLSDETIAKGQVRLQESTGLPLKMLGAYEILGAMFACQTFVAQHPESEGKGFACDMLGNLLWDVAVLEDIENYELRGFGYPPGREMFADLMKKITADMKEGVRRVEKDGVGPIVDLIFAHDSSVFPMVAMLELLDLGDDPASSQAALHCPFASRISIEVASCGAILVHYNGMLMRVFPGGIQEWESTFSSVLSKSTRTVCGSFDLEFEYEDVSALVG